MLEPADQIMIGRDRFFAEEQRTRPELRRFRLDHALGLLIGFGDEIGRLALGAYVGLAEPAKARQDLRLCRAAQQIGKKGRVDNRSHVKSSRLGLSEEP